MRTPGAMLILAVPLAAHAATWQVPGDFSHIDVAIAEALPGDRIEVGPGAWTKQLLIEKDLEIVGTAGPTATKIKVVGDANPSVRISGAIVLLEGFRISNDSARAIEIDGATVDLVDITITGQSTADSGAAICVVNESDVLIDGSTFEDNVSGLHGGHIFSENSSLTIRNSSFISGTAAKFGGAIAFDTGETHRLDVTASALLGNSATSGGGLWVSGDDGTVGLTSNVLDANTAESGGGLYAKAIGEITAGGNLFCRNDATLENGGAVYAEDIGVSGDNEWTNNLFVENTAIANGGALFVKGQKTRLRNNHLLANGAGGNGGAVYFDASTYTFLNNLVAYTQTGDGVHATSSVALLYGDWFDNTAQHVSGALDLGNLGNGTLYDDPLLVAYSTDGNCGNDDFRPAPGSPLIDAGSPAHKDPDGSDGDIGAFGGPDSAPDLLDGDGDGVSFVYDCNDQDRDVSPIALEVCDPADVDEDCDGFADDLDPEGAQGAPSWYGDGDGDGYGDASDPRGVTCDGAVGTVANALDCDDDDGAIHPDADEVCDPDDTDEDCDGLADNDDPEGALGETFWYDDADGDGYGDAFDPGVTACDAPTGSVEDALDCDDGDHLINPDGAEVCDPEHDDEDCDGLADDADPDVTGRADLCPDTDGDGFGDASTVPVTVCPSEGWVVDCTDCDDLDGTVHPGADERTGDGVDQDCDGTDARIRYGNGAPGTCGCGSGSAPAGWLWVLLMALAMRRRAGEPGSERGPSC
ncbi:MAG: hypothetical protein JRJ84_12870 [Deltaproteobacteria bacterium]|nr:hypothetical protein [Deltaproteobacteria bacterium]